MQSATPPLPPDDEPSWKNPRFLIWMFAIGAIIYNSITYANVAILGSFFGYFIYYVLATLWYKFAFKYSFAFDPNGGTDPDTDEGKNNIKFGIMSFINFLLTISIFVASLWAIRNMMGVFVIIAILIAFIGAVIYGYYVKTQIKNGAEPDKLFKLYKSTISALFNFDYAALSLLFPINLIYTKVIDTNNAYDDKVNNAKNQTVNDNEIPSPLGEQIVYGSALSILMLTLVSYWWKFRTTLTLLTVRLGGV
jgi:hypothetical protein